MYLLFLFVNVHCHWFAVQLFSAGASWTCCLGWFMFSLIDSLCICFRQVHYVPVISVCWRSLWLFCCTVIFSRCLMNLFFWLVNVQNQQTRELISAQCVTQVQQQRPELPTVTLTWHACRYKVHNSTWGTFSVGVCILYNRGCTSGGVYVPCIYTHARWELL